MLPITILVLLLILVVEVIAFPGMLKTLGVLVGIAAVIVPVVLWIRHRRRLKNGDRYSSLTPAERWDQIKRKTEDLTDTAIDGVGKRWRRWF